MMTLKTFVGMLNSKAYISTVGSKEILLQFMNSVLPVLSSKMVKSLPAVRETWDPPLSQGESVDRGMATHCSVLACKIPWTEELGGLHSMGLQRVRHNWSD